jgi:hypothetical protein
VVIFIFGSFAIPVTGPTNGPAGGSGDQLGWWKLRGVSAAAETHRSKMHHPAATSRKSVGIRESPQSIALIAMWDCTYRTPGPSPAS